MLTFVGAVRREADRRGDPPRAAARGPGLLHPQPGRVDRPGRGPAARARARGADRDRARPDERARRSSRSWSTSGRSEFDVLVCTTIVESGLDISNANTLIVERADMLRPLPAAPAARPGRPRPRARLRLLPLPAGEAAHRDRARPAGDDRRSTPTSGAGMYVAMKDLEIRGAGNLLGGEQSGHIAGVGFDLYVRLVGEAVADYRARRGGASEEPPRGQGRAAGRRAPPARLRPGRAAAAEAYRAIAAVDTEEDIEAVREELADRYGELPEPVENLLAVAAVPRCYARRAGLTEVALQGSNVRFAPWSCASRSSCGCSGSTRARWSSRRSVRSWCRAHDRPGRRAAAARRRAPALVPRPRRWPCCSPELAEGPR